MTQTQLQQPDSSALGAIKSFDLGTILEELDNFGLTPVQFRIYCHLLTGADPSGTVSMSSESIAKVCKLTRITVLRVVAQLEKMGMIVCFRVSGKKTVFHLQPPSSWHCEQAAENQATQPSNLMQFPVSTRLENQGSDGRTPSVKSPDFSATCKTDIPVNEINSYQSEQVPLKGTCPTVAEANLVSESNWSTPDTGNEPEMTLDAKLDAVRQLGCNIGRVWRSGHMEIIVDGLFMSVESFMHRSLSSFKENLQPCEAGLNLFREAITSFSFANALIKQKIALAKRHKESS